MLKQAARSVAVMLRYAKKPTVISLLMQILQAIQPPLGVYFTGQLVNGIGGYINGTEGFNEVLLWAVLLLAVLLLAQSSGLITQLTDINCQKALTQGFTSVVLEKFKKLEYWCFEDKDTLDSLERMGTQPHERIHNLFRNTVTAVSCLISLIGTAIVFTKVAVWFAAAYFLLLTPMLWFDYKFTEAVQRLWNTEMPNWRRHTYLSALWLTLNGTVSVGVFGACIAAFLALQSQKMDILINSGNLPSHLAFAADYFAFVDLPNERSGGIPYSGLTNGIEINGVSFQYPNAEEKAVSNLYFSIKKGEKIAILGENGSGKTTFTKLLLGLLPASGGEILYDGVNVD